MQFSIYHWVIYCTWISHSLQLFWHNFLKILASMLTDWCSMNYRRLFFPGTFSIHLECSTVTVHELLIVYSSFLGIWINGSCTPVLINVPCITFLYFYLTYLVYSTLWVLHSKRCMCFHYCSVDFSGLWWCQPAPPGGCVPGQGPLWTNLLQPGQHVCPQNTSGIHIWYQKLKEWMLWQGR